MRHTIVRSLAAAVVLAALTSCDGLTSPNFNAGDFDDLENNPTRTSISAAARGLLHGARVYQAAAANDYPSILGVLGRESYNLDTADPRFLTSLLGGPLDASAGAFGGNFWSEPYRNIRLAKTVIDGIARLPDDPVTGMSETEKEAVRGFAKTIQALDLLHVVNTRDFNCDGRLGCPFEVSENRTELAPARTREQVQARVSELLDQAVDHLQNGGSAFPFTMPSGFAGFDTPETFLLANRALAARVLVYRGEFADALVALEESFLDDTRPLNLDLGVYHSFGTGSGDLTNGMFQPSDDPNLRAHVSIQDSVEFQADGTTPDARFERKTRPIAFRTIQGIGSDVGFDIYDRLDAPVPIIRNEELVLLRAEANIGLGDLGAAAADIDLIREDSGSLPPVGGFGSQQEALDQLLYEKKYSLLFEGGHHWIDLRRYDRIDHLPIDDPSHVRNAAFPVPTNEQLARQ